MEENVKNIEDNIINKLKKVIENFQNLYNIYEDVINNYNDKLLNYEVISNINEIKNKNDEVVKVLKKINEDNNFINQIYNILDVYQKMNNLENNEITIRYEIINKEYNFTKNKYTYNFYNEIRLFGEHFVKNNKNICKYILDGVEYELESKINISNIDKSKGILEIKLTNVNKITDASNMFYECDNLIAIPDIQNWNISNLINTSNMFYKCKLFIFVRYFKMGYI